jgi:hypothetical protein
LVFAEGDAIRRYAAERETGHKMKEVNTIMKSKDTAAVLHNVLRSIAAKPPTRNGQSSFASVVKMGFDDICDLREKGYSFRSIMEKLVEAGFFPEGADSKYLCQAFAREKRKREHLGLTGGNFSIRSLVHSR